MHSPPPLCIANTKAYTLTHCYSWTPNTTVPKIICTNLHMRIRLYLLAMYIAVIMSTRSNYPYGYIFTCTRWYIAADNNMEQLITAFRNRSSTLAASEELDIVASDDSIGLLWRLPHYNCRQTSDVSWQTRYCKESCVDFQDVSGLHIAGYENALDAGRITVYVHIVSILASSTTHSLNVSKIMF